MGRKKMKFIPVVLGSALFLGAVNPCLANGMSDPLANPYPGYAEFNAAMSVFCAAPQPFVAPDPTWDCKDPTRAYFASVPNS